MGWACPSHDRKTRVLERHGRPPLAPTNRKITEIEKGTCYFLDHFRWGYATMAGIRSAILQEDLFAACGIQDDRPAPGAGV